MRCIDRHGAFVQQCDEHAPGPAVQCCRCREQGGAGHARSAADHRHVAVAALVGCMQASGRRRRTAEPGARFLDRCNTQIIPPHRTACIAAVRCEQARLQRQQAQRLRGANTRRVAVSDAKRVAGVGIQSGWDIDRNHLPRRPRIQLRHPTGHDAVQRPHVADAQQGVDGCIPFAWRLRGERDADVPGASKRGQRIRRHCRLVAQPGDNRPLAPLLQMHCGFEPITAVVAWSAGKPHGTRMRCNRQHQLCDGKAGTLHQGMRWQLRCGHLFDATRRRDVEQRPRPVVSNALHFGN